MPSIIDSLIIELSLDATKLDEGQRDMVGKLRQLESATQAHIKPVEAGFNQLIGTFKEFQARLLGIGALIAGGIGLDRLVGDLSKVNAQAGYLAKSLGITTKELTVWQAAGRTMGVAPEDSGSGLATLKQVYAERSLLGSGGLFRLGGSYKGLGAKLNQLGPNASPTDVAMALAEWAQKEEKDPNRARFALQNIGMSQGMTNMIMQGPDKLQKMLKEADKFGVSEDQAKTFQELLKSFGNLTNEADKLARTIVVGLAPALEAFLGWLNKIVAAVQPPENAPHVNETGRFMTDSPFGRLWKRLRGRSDGGSYPAGGDPMTSGGAGSAASDAARSSAMPSPPSGGGGATPSPQSSNDQAVPGEILAQAKHVALEGGPAAVSSFMRSQGYPKNGAWCGEFAASVVRSVGGTPPKGAAIASNWRNWGDGITGAPKPGDIAIRNGPRTGSTGSHVTIVSGFDPKTGTFTGIGGNQGGGRATESRFGVGSYSFRRAHTPEEPVAAGLPGRLPNSGAAGRLFDQWKGSSLPSSIPPGGPGGSTTTNSNSSQTSIGAMHVTVPQNANPEEYADGIREHLQRNDPVLHSLTGMN